MERQQSDRWAHLSQVGKELRRSALESDNPASKFNGLLMRVISLEEAGPGFFLADDGTVGVEADKAAEMGMMFRPFADDEPESLIT